MTTDFGRLRDEARERAHIYSMRRDPRLPDASQFQNIPYCVCTHEHAAHWRYAKHDEYDIAANVYTGGPCRVCQDKAPPCPKFRFWRYIERMK